MRAEALCGLLAEPDRLAVFSAVVLGARTPGQVAAATGLSARQVASALRRLTDGGLLVDSGAGGGSIGDALVADAAVFKQAVRRSGRDPAPEPLDPDPGRAGILRAFIHDGRLRQMPAARGKRRVVLEHIAASFEPGLKYPEREVDAVLRAWHADYATLRRFLVDEEFMAREAGVYWRIGGPVH